jgi:hypothetical protein
MKQTAVEWLIDMLVTENEVTLKGENYKLFEIAKQMEKEQIIKSFDDGYAKCGITHNAQEYYKETFNKEI